MMRKILTLSICLSFVACGEYEVLDYNKKLRKKVDSLYRVNRDSIVNISDSLCTSYYPQFLSEAKDSLEKVRIKEIKKLIKD